MTVSLILLGSYLTAIAFTGITLLPLTVVASAVSGGKPIPCGGITPFCDTATLQDLTQIFISEFAFGIACLACSAIVAFFRFETITPRTPWSQPQILSPQISRTSELTTEQLIAELKVRMPKTSA